MGTGGKPATKKGQDCFRFRCRHVWINVNPVVTTTREFIITTASFGSSMNSRNGIAKVPIPKLMVPSTSAPRNTAASPMASSQPASIRFPRSRATQARLL